MMVQQRGGRSTRFSFGFIAALLAAANCSKPPSKPQRAAVSVSVVNAQRAPVPYTIEANGVVTPLQTVAVASQVEGVLTKVQFREGQDVARGQVLFLVDSRPYQASFDQARAMLARDRATAENAKKEADRYDLLAQTGVVSQEEADALRTTNAAAQATVLADSAMLATAKFNLDNTTIRAPISGRTGSLLVREGNLVHASGATTLVVINQVKPILVRFAVPATELPLILQYGRNGGLPVSAVAGGPATTLGDSTGGTRTPPETTPLSDAMAARQGRATADPQGSLSFIDNAVDTTTATVQLKATFANTSGSLWPGQFVYTSMRLFVEQNALVIPAQAVVTGQAGTYVYVIDSSGTAQQRTVVVERNTNGLAIVSAGVQEGEQVVTDGQSRLTPGASVNLRNPNDTTAAAAGGRGRGRGGRGRGGAGGGGGGSAGPG
jgi:membrane fusion protein, multidrug efflux system